jgi:hypothetical protein
MSPSLRVLALVVVLYSILIVSNTPLSPLLAV